MVKAHKIKLYPTKSQKKLFIQSCGVARFAFNWALTKWQENHKQGVTQSAYSLIKHLNSIKRTEFPWMQITGKTCSQYAIHNLETAFKNMWKCKLGYPKFKKKSGEKDSFVAVENKEHFKQKDFKIWIPRIGWVKCAENLRFVGKVNNVTVTRVADVWFSVVNIDISNETPMVSESQTIVGVDLGIKKMIVLSDGTTFENPQALHKNLKGMKRLQRGLARKVKGSNNRAKQRMRVARKYYRISCIRKDAIHKATSFIIDRYNTIIVEDLNVRGLVKNHKLSQAISDVSFGEVVRQLSYKAEWANKEIIKADRFFASSKICSKCGHKKESLNLSERIYKCDDCGLSIDRDLNAAKNLASYSPTSKFEGRKACGDGSSASKMMYSPSVNQEINSVGLLKHL